MSRKILLIGSAPLPNEKSGIREAAGLRTEQFLSPLQNSEKNNEIVVIAISNTNKIPEISRSEIREEYFPKKNTRIFWISRHSKILKSFIQTEISEFSPDACIGVNTFPAYILSTVLVGKLKNIPFWADLNGWIMSEGQARGYTENTNLHLANAFQQERKILSTADKISTVSTAQKFATIGELASMGLLRKENFLEEKVFALPNCTKFFEIDKSKNDEIKLFRKNADSRSLHTTQNKNIGNKFSDNNDNNNNNNNMINIPDDAFVISWIGGYNNWVDEKTLFEGLEKAMSTDDDLYFVSTGGAIKNIANKTFSSFLSRIDNSKYKSRFVFLGWIETKDMRKIYIESDAGINVDFLCIETETGARNRINEMLKFGLPVITTGGSEIAEISGKFGAGITVKNGKSDELSQAILSLSQLKNSKNPEKKQKFLEYGKQGQKLSTEIFHEDIIQKPVLNFVENPKKTTLKRLPLESPFFFFQNTILYLKRNGLKIFWAKVKQRIF